MGRHATIAGRQASSAAARGKLFTKLAREITVSARMGGGEPAANPRLRMAIDRARNNSMPKENIERAIKKGLGTLEGEQYEEIVYEGYGPGGTAYLVEVMTDNRNRTNPELKRIFEKNGGNIGSIGSVAWMFKRVGIIEINGTGHNPGDLSAPTVTEDQIMEIVLETGAQDVCQEDGWITVFTDISNFSSALEALEQAKIPLENSQLIFRPDACVPIDEPHKTANQQLIQKLEDHDDVQNVYHNMNFD